MQARFYHVLGVGFAIFLFFSFAGCTAMHSGGQEYLATGTHQSIVRAKMQSDPVSTVSNDGVVTEVYRIEDESQIREKASNEIVNQALGQVSGFWGIPGSVTVSTMAKEALANGEPVFYKVTYDKESCVKQAEIVDNM